MKKNLSEMMSSIPKEKGINTDKEILRVGIISELDAISLYEQLSEIATDEKIKKTLLDIAKEEKAHVGEFESLLLSIDSEQSNELESGAEEVASMEEAKTQLYGKTSQKKLEEMYLLLNKICQI